MSSKPNQPPANVLTVDVEDWYHLTGQQIRSHGTLQPDILARQLDHLLELLNRHQTRATFFCLGSSLVDAPHLVQRIADAGHEIASHGWGHQPIRQIGIDAFRQDLHRSIDWLANLVNRPILGYRAPAFSVDPNQLEAFYDVCFNAELRYDSSVFPIAGRRYGIPTANPRPHVVRQADNRQLIELPLSTIDRGNKRRPVSGGGYWRLMTVGRIHRAIDTLNQQGRPMVTYLHPYEFDPHSLSAFRAAGWSLASLRHHLRQNIRRPTMTPKLDQVLGQHRFTAVEDYLRDHPTF